MPKTAPHPLFYTVAIIFSIHIDGRARFENIDAYRTLLLVMSPNSIAVTVSGKSTHFPDLESHNEYKSRTGRITKCPH